MISPITPVRYTTLNTKKRKDRRCYAASVQKNAATAGELKPQETLATDTIEAENRGLLSIIMKYLFKTP